MNRLWTAIATLVGTIVGAGVLGVPYVVAKVGLLPGIASIIGLDLIMLLVNLYIGEIVLRTKGNHQLSGYAERYIGSWGRIVLGVALIIQLSGAMVAYTIGEGHTFRALLGGNAFISCAERLKNSWGCGARIRTGFYHYIISRVFYCRTRHAACKF